MNNVRLTRCFFEERLGQRGPYTAILYSPSAQTFIYDNIDAIIASRNEK